MVSTVDVIEKRLTSVVPNVINVRKLEDVRPGVDDLVRVPHERVHDQRRHEMYEERRHRVYVVEDARHEGKDNVGPEEDRGYPDGSTEQQRPDVFRDLDPDALRGEQEGQREDGEKVHAPTEIQIVERFLREKKRVGSSRWHRTRGHVDSVSHSH